MELGYKQSVWYSTLELQWCNCDPPLRFEFNNATSIEFGIRLTQFAVNDEWQESELIDLASKLLLTVEREDGVSYPLGTPKTIISLISNSHIEFVRDVVMGWFLLVGIERAALKKRYNGSNGR